MIDVYERLTNSAYNVDDNIDLFYNDVKEGINTILIGMFNKFELPLVVLGCNGLL